MTSGKNTGNIEIPLDYRQALELLNSRGNEVQGIHLGLHRISSIMQAMGNPHWKIPALHIGGTNGKGSVAAMSESILRHGGWKTGLYTSPHLVRIEERIRVDGQEISTACFADLTTRIRQEEKELLGRNALDRPLTYFEFLTACAFLHFSEQRVDVAVVEVGLGGALDATNIVIPRVCVITGISYDHQDLLGNTLEEIARAKAGIIKPGAPLVSGCRAPAARHVIREKAHSTGAGFREIDRCCSIRVAGERRGRSIIDLQTQRGLYRQLRLSLAGEHQIRNAALAVAAVEALEDFPVSAEAVRRGLANTCWPGRMDEYRARRRTLLDGAHNLEGARLLRRHLCRQQESKIHLVFGALRDKDIRGMGKCLFPVALRIHLAPLDNLRSAAPREIAALHKGFLERMTVHRNAREALQSAWQTCPRNGLVVVTGSLYLLGEILPLVRSR